jgi:murein L,D-transpeptidase YafK
LDEGDRQAPEGFYSVTPQQLVLTGRHARSLDLGYPNAFDRSLGRTGSHILVHGGCRSTGCFAMTDPIMERVYAVAECPSSDALRQVEASAKGGSGSVAVLA